MKKLTATLLAITMMITSIVFVFAEQEDIKVIVNDVVLEFDQPPVIENDRTLVPLRVIAESLNCKVDWNEESQRVTMTNLTTGSEVKITIGEKIIWTGGGRGINLDAAAKVENGRTLVPLRAISEAFNCYVYWDDTTNTVIIYERSSEGMDKIIEFNKRKDFPSDEDYKLIEDLLTEKYGYAENIEYTEGVKDNVKYISGSMELKNVYQRIAVVEVYELNKDLSGPIRNSSSYDISEGSYLNDEEYETLIEEQIERYSKPTEKDLKNHGWMYGVTVPELAHGLDSRQWEQLKNLREWTLRYIIKDDMTDIEKVKAVHDWIISRSAYDTAAYNAYTNIILSKEMSWEEQIELYEKTMTAEENSPYGPLVLKKSACGGFAEAFQFMMEGVGIESIIVTGFATELNKEWRYCYLDSHEWNLVKVDGNWYNIDLTWDNPSNNTPSGKVKYDYFLLSDKEINSKRKQKDVIPRNSSDTMHECTSTIDVGFKR